MEVSNHEQGPRLDGLVRVGPVVEQVRPVARALLGDRDPGELGIRDLRAGGETSHQGGVSEVYYVQASAGDDEFEFVWKRALAGEAEADCLERCRIERARYLSLAGRTTRTPVLYAEMLDSDQGAAIAIEYLPRLATQTYRDGEPSAREIGMLATALAEFARDIPVEETVPSYRVTVLDRIRGCPRTSRIWEFAVDAFARQGHRLDELETVMSPGYHATNIGFRADSDEPVFFDLATVRPRPIGSGLVTGLAFRPDLDDVAEVISTSIPQLGRDEVYLLALGQILEGWAEGDVRGRPAACHCLDALGIHISDEIRSS
jgi:hypothetical protein